MFIASYFTDDRECAHCNREHTLIYIHSGELEITDGARKTILRQGDCAFMRRDNRMWLQKRVKDGTPYRSMVMKFSHEYLRKFFRTLNRREIPAEAKREKASLVKFPPNRPDVRSFFESLQPYFDTGPSPDEEILKMKMAEEKISELTPQKWLICRRLEAARELIRKSGRKISDICFDVGFKNLSHFSRLYKEMYGMAPTLS